MRYKNFKKYLAFLLFIVVIIPIQAFAKANVILSVDKKDLEAGDIVTVSAKLPSETKLYALTATLSYDTNVFEEMDDTNFASDDENIEILYNNKNHKFGILNKAGEISNELFRVQLKVKDNANVGDTDISLTNISSSDGNKKTTFDKTSVELLVTRDAKEGETIPNPITKEEFTMPEEIIKTFSTKPIMIALTCGACILLIGFLYVLFKRKNKAVILSFLGGTILLSAALGCIFVFSHQKKDVNDDGNQTYEDAKEIMKYLLDMEGTRQESSDKKEEENNDLFYNVNTKPNQNNSNPNSVNNSTNNNSNNNNNTNTNNNNNSSNNDDNNNSNNSNNNTDDTNNNNTNTNTNNNNNSNQNNKPSHDFDVNNDGKVDIDDVGGSTQDTTEKTNYKVNFTTRNPEELYVRKGDITLEFYAEVTLNEKIKEVEINGIYYPVIFNNNYYKVTLKEENAGVKNFKITKVKLANKREVTTNYTIQKEVLKDEPYVDLFEVDDKSNAFSFHLEDKDKAFKSGKVVVTNEKNEVVFEENIQEENLFYHQFEKDVKYNIAVFIDYDLDSNTFNSVTGDQNLFEDQLIYTHSFVVTSGYDFKIFNVSITDAIQKGETPVLSFDSTNSKGYSIEYLVINGKEYDITSITNKTHYTVELSEGFDTSTFGKYYVDIDAIVLKNLKIFYQETDFETSTFIYNVLKYEPTIEQIELQNHAEEQSITVNYQLKDEDETLENLTAVLVDSTEKVVDKIENVNPKESFTLSYQGNNDGRYRVKFLADCNLGTEKHIYKSKNIGEKEILTQTDIYIKNATVTTVYPTKKQPKYKITFEISVSDNFKANNIYNVVSGITLNGLNYDADKTGKAFTSNISFTVPSESGILDLTANRVQLQFEDYNRNIHQFFSVEPYHFQIDVLKDEPKIENLEIVKEDYENSSVTFKFDVVEDKGGFQSGVVELGDKSSAIHLGSNEVTFTDIESDKNLSLNFYANYDLDTNTLEGQDTSLNYYENDLIYTESYRLMNSNIYEEIKVIEPKVTTKKNHTYFEKNEEGILKFRLEGLESEANLVLKKVMINQKEYEVKNEDDMYTITFEGYPDAGIQTLEMTDLLFQNGKRVSLQTPVNVSLEVLKDAVTLYDFNYGILNQQINMNFVIQDDDHSLMSQKDLKIVVTDEDGKELLNIPYQDKVSMDIIPNVLRYYVNVYASYDRDSNQDSNNYYSNQKILDEVISLDKNIIELKEITDVTLYKQNGTLVTEEEKVSVSDITQNKDAYFLKITMNGMPTIHSKIRSVLTEENKLILVLDYQYVSKELNEVKDVRISFGTIQNGVVFNETKAETFAGLIARMIENPTEDFELTQDVDASEFVFDRDTLVNVDFKGTLNGNGHRIYNLTKPIFDTITDGTVKNLRIEGIILTPNAHGTIANKATNTLIENVYIDTFTKKDTEGATGALVGEAVGHSIIRHCRATNLTIGVAWNRQQVGGMVGILENSIIEDSYVSGTISSNWNYIGGLVGNVKGASVIRYNYAKMTMSSDSLSCGFACVTGSATFQNNVNLSTGRMTHKFVTNYKKSENNYQIEMDGYTAQEGVTIITENQVNEELFKTANFDETIWNLSDVSFVSPPTFLDEKVSKLDVSKVEGLYDERKETLYENLMLFMPYYDVTKIVQSGANIDVNHILNKKKITHIIPVDHTGNIVTYLTNDNPKKIVKIKIIFEDNSKAEYNVRYENMYDMIASYRISELKIDYTYNHYVIDKNSQLVNNLTNYLAKLTYEDNLDALTPSADNRLYREFYYDVTQKELKEFVLKYLSNSDYTNTNSDEAINDYLEKEIKKGQKLEKVLYVYNYFRRFYDVKIEGIKLYDLLLFHSEGFHPNLTVDGITKEYLADENNFNTSKTSDAYGNTIGKYTTYKTIPKLIEYYLKGLSDKTPAVWFKENYQGYLVEINVDNRPDIMYTMWDHLSYEDKNNRAVWYNYVLPILTIPKNASYIISTPTQFVIGSQRVYIADPDDPVEQEKFRNQAAIYTARMKDYYQTAAGILEDAKYFNEIHTIQIDKRFTYDENGNQVFQSPLTTQEPFHKNFNEVFGQWAHQDGNAATANGTVIFWRAEGALEGEWTYSTWSHETAHNMDARLFLKNNGRRYDAGGEDYADGNLTQSFGDGDIVMNLSRHFEANQLISANLDPSRIQTSKQIQDFYSKLFDTLYILDYLEGKAFLELTSEEQSKLAVQVFYPNEEKYTEEKDKYLKDKYTVYHTISEEEFEKMNLETLDDLYTNQLVMYPGVIYSTLTDNRYGGENIYKVRWYQPHNDFGRPDSYSLKWFAYEMLGYKGYNDGYIEYYSNIHSDNGYKTDLMALRKITGNENMTFESYKHMRFAETEKKLSSVQYINIDEVYKSFLDALRKDAAYVKEVEQKAEEQYPGDEKANVDKRNSMISEARKFKNSTEVRRQAYYAIKNGTHDFEGNVFDATHPQEIHEVK